MNDLQTRITEYVDSTVPPIDIDLLVEALNQGEEPTRRLRPEPANRKWWQHRRWVPVLAAAIVVLLMVGGAALLRDPSEAPVITTPEQTSTSTTSLPAAAPGPWVRQELRYEAGLGETVEYGSVYGGPITVDGTTLLKAVAYKDGLRRLRPEVAGSLRPATRGPGVMSGDAARSGRRSTDHRGHG